MHRIPLMKAVHRRGKQRDLSFSCGGSEEANGIVQSWRWDTMREGLTNQIETCKWVILKFTYHWKTRKDEKFRWVWKSFACKLHESFQSQFFLVPVQDTVKPELVFICDVDVAVGKCRLSWDQGEKLIKMSARFNCAKINLSKKLHH